MSEQLPRNECEPYTIGDQRFDDLSFNERSEIDTEVGHFEMEVKELRGRLEHIIGQLFSRDRMIGVATGETSPEEILEAAAAEWKAQALSNERIGRAFERLKLYADIVQRAKDTGYLETIKEGRMTP